VIEFDLIPELYLPFVNAYKKAEQKKADISYTYRYDRSVQLFMDIAVHAKGLFPDRLIGANAPSETDEELRWRKLAYAPFTKAPWSRLESAMSSIYHGVGVVTEDEELSSYLTEGYPTYSGLVEWFSEMALPNKAQDGNGVIYVTVLAPPQSDVDVLEPVAMVANSPEVIHYGKDYALIVIGYDAPVKKGRETVYEGLRMALMDEEYEYRITQVGKKYDYVFDVEEYYRHGYGKIPAWQLKGKPIVEQGEMLWESLFQNAVPYLDKAALESSTLDAVIRRTGFPTRVYYDEDCDAPGCNEGWVMDLESGERHHCGVCKGTGKKAFTPFTDYVHSRPTGMLPDSQPNFPGLQYVSPDNAPMEFLDAHIDKLIERAGEAVNYDLSRKRGGELTATEANIDLNEWYKTALLFAQQLYDINDYVIDAIAKIRYPFKEIEYTLTRRVEFSIRNPEQLAQELRQANEAGLPGFVVTKLIDSQINLRFADDFRMIRLSEIAKFVDPLYGKSAKDSVMLIGRGVQDWQAVLHFQFQQLIEQAEAQNPRFLELELPEISATLQSMARAMVPQQFNPANILDSVARA
jgi:hypothetical protein